MKKPKEPSEPVEMHDTVRQGIVAELQNGPRSARDLSSALGVSERDVYGHLDHIRQSLASAGSQLVVYPAECKKCGFVFVKREKLSRPGRCPKCRGESIRMPLFSIEVSG